MSLPEQKPTPKPSHKAAGDKSPAHLRIRSTQTYGIMLAISVYVCAFVHKNLENILSFPASPDILEKWGMITILGIGIVLTTSYIFESSFASYRAHRDSLRKLIGPLSFLGCIYLAFIAAVGEEFLFRGVLQPYLGMVMSSALVCLLQVSPSLKLTAWSLMGFLTSLLVGAIFAHTNNLYPGMIIHFALNLFYLLRIHWQLSSSARSHF